MNKNNRPLWIVILVLIVINLLSLGSLWITRDRGPDGNAEFRRSDRKPPPHLAQKHFIPNRLKFDQEQQVKFDSLAMLHSASLSSTMDEIKLLRKQLIDQIGKNEPDSVADLIYQLGQQQIVLEEINFQHFENVMSLCDEDQQKAFRKIIHRGFQVKNRLSRRVMRERHRQN